MRVWYKNIFYCVVYAWLTIGSLSANDLELIRDPFMWKELKKAPMQKSSDVQQKQHVVVSVKKEKEQKQKIEFPWLLCGISVSQESSCALFSQQDNTKVVHMNEELSMGWKIEKITNSYVYLKHQTGESKRITV